MIGCDCAVCTSRDPRDSRIAAVCLSHAARRHRRSSSTRRPICGSRRCDSICVAWTPCSTRTATPIMCWDWTTCAASTRCSTPAFRAMAMRRRCARFGRRSRTSSIRRRRPAAGCRRSICSRVDWRILPGDARDHAGAAVARPAARLRVPHRIARLPDRLQCDSRRSWELIEGVELLVIDALRHRPHPTHFSVAEALAVVDRLGPRAGVVYPHLPRLAPRRDQRRAA